MKRRTAREKAVQALFQIDLSDADPNEAIEHVLNGQEKDTFLVEIVNGTVKELEQIDTIIKNHLENWSIERIGNVDRTILRLAVFEMIHLEEIPVNVTLNEAIELSKVFGDDETSKFVNAVLSKIKITLEK